MIRFPEIPASETRRFQSWLCGLLLVGAVVAAYQPAWRPRLCLGRRQLRCQQSTADGAGRTEANLVFARFAVPVFPSRLHHVSVGTQLVGSESRRLSLGQHPAARGQCASRVEAFASVERSRRMAGLGNLRPAPGQRGIGGLDHAAQKHVVAIFYFAGGAGLDRVCGNTGQLGDGTEWRWSFTHWRCSAKRQLARSRRHCF